MIRLIAKWTVLPGKLEEAISVVKDLASEVRSTESGTLIYLVHSINVEGFNNPGNPFDGQIIFYEAYKDEEALNMHLYGPNGLDNPSGPYADFLKKYSSLFLRDNKDNNLYVRVDSLDFISGFVRNEKVVGLC